MLEVIIIVIIISVFLFYLIYKPNNTPQNIVLSDDNQIGDLRGKINEISKACGYNSTFTVRKGKQSVAIGKKDIYLCTEGKNGEKYDMNVLMYVGLHELAHVLCPDIVLGDNDPHTDNWKEIFTTLLTKARDKGYYDPNIPMIREEDYCPT